MHKTFKVIRMAGTSPVGYEDAIKMAISDAHESLRGLNWFEVVEQRGRIDENGVVHEWQVVIDVAFKVEGKK
ncbi:MAG: dodecin domain-containing protein [Nitrospinae bacterium]|nr:dodecin domain-containing protein [Nitrospinota bacterium]